MTDSGLHDRLAVAALQRQLNEAQDTISRLEAMHCKSLQQDFEYRKQIAEAVELLREASKYDAAEEVWQRISAYLAKLS